MLRDAAVALLGQRLGNRTDLAASIIEEMQLVQGTLLEKAGTFLPWFLEADYASLSTVANTEAVALPTNFLGWIEDEPVWLYDTTATAVWDKLPRKRAGTLREKYTTTGRPLEHAVGVESLLFAPVPDAVYTIKFRYYAADTVLSTNIENKWLKHASDLLIAKTGEIMASQYLMNTKLTEVFTKAAQEATARVYTQHENREHSGRSYQMGED